MGHLPRLCASRQTYHQNRLNLIKIVRTNKNIRYNAIDFLYTPIGLPLHFWALIRLCLNLMGSLCAYILLIIENVVYTNIV